MDRRGRAAVAVPSMVGMAAGMALLPLAAGAVSLTAGSAVATLGASALVVAGLAGLGAGWLARALDPRSQPERRAAS